MTQNDLFEQFAPTIQNAGIINAKSEELLLHSDEKISIYYAPFDYVNTQAKIVLVGITPGRFQAETALKKAQQELTKGTSNDVILKLVKQAASFGGPMRKNLTDLMNYFDIHSICHVASSEELFSSRTDCIHFTSVLKYPVFTSKGNYSGTPDPISHPALRKQILDFFAKEAASLDQAIFIPLGPVPTKVLSWLCEQKLVPFGMERVLSGFPHPSGANMERIKYMLEEKPAASLSSKTNPAILDAARVSIKTKVYSLNKHAK